MKCDCGNIFAIEHDQIVCKNCGVVFDEPLFVYNSSKERIQQKLKNEDSSVQYKRWYATKIRRTNRLLSNIILLSVDKNDTRRQKIFRMLNKIILFLGVEDDTTPINNRIATKIVAMLDNVPKSLFNKNGSTRNIALSCLYKTIHEKVNFKQFLDATQNCGFVFNAQLYNKFGIIIQQTKIFQHDIKPNKNNIHTNFKKAVCEKILIGINQCIISKPFIQEKKQYILKEATNILANLPYVSIKRFAAKNVAAFVMAQTIKLPYIGTQILKKDIASSLGVDVHTIRNIEKAIYQP